MPERPMNPVENLGYWKDRAGRAEDENDRLTKILARAYPFLTWPDDVRGADTKLDAEFDAIVRAVEVAIQHLPDEKLCGADDGATVCTRDAGHPIPHRAENDRQWI